MKRKIRLTENQLHNVITESVKQVLSELDWKTYTNAYLKAKDYVKNNWDNDFRYIDKLQTDKDLLNRHEKYLKNVDRYNDFLEKADKEFKKNISPDIQVNGPLYFDSNDDGEKVWGLSWNEKLANNPEELRRVTDKYSDEWNNMKDFFDGKYEYQKGKGWKKKDGLDESIRRKIRLTESKLHNIVKESVRRVIKEFETVKIAPDADEISVDGNVFYCTFNGMDIEWHVDYDVANNDGDIDKLKEWLSSAIAMSGKMWQVPYLLNNNLPFSSEIYINGEKVDYPR